MARRSRMAASKEFRDKIEEKKGSEWYDAAKKVGDLHDPHMSRDGETARYSGAEIRAELRAGRGDRTVDEMIDYYEDAYRKGDINLNGNAKEFLREKHGAVLERMKKEGPGPNRPPRDPRPEGPNDEDPRDNTPDPIDKAPGKGPGAPDIENWLPAGGWGENAGGGGGGGGGNNVASQGGANATGAGSTASGVYNSDTGNQGDMTFGDNAILNDVNFGTITDIRNYGSGIGGGGSNGYGSAIGNAAMYMDEAQDRFEDTSGLGYGLKVMGAGRNFGLQNEYVDANALSERTFNTGLAMMDLGNLYDVALNGQYTKPTKFIMPEDIEDDTDEQLERLEGIAD